MAFTLKARIGRGRTTETFTARLSVGSEELDVAVKRPRPEYAANEAFIAAFLRWAEEQKEIDHENVVGVLEAGRLGEGAYVIQERVEGVSLAELLLSLSKKKRTMSMKLALSIAERIAFVLASLHEKKIVHGGLDPSEVLISYQGDVKVGDQKLRALDVHLGADLGEEKTGTAMYRAPELSEKKTGPTPASDVYSLALVILECLIGKPVWTAHSMTVQAAIGALRDFTHVGQAQPALTEDLSAVLLGSAQEKPEDRVQSGKDLHAGLVRIIKAHGLEAKREELAAFVEALVPPTRVDDAPTTIGDPAMLQAIERARASSLERIEGTSTPIDPELERKALSRVIFVDQVASAAEAAERSATQKKKKLELIAGVAVIALILALLGVHMATRTGKGVKILEVHLTSDPPAAVVFLDGEKVGTTPINKTLPAHGEEVELRFELKGFVPLEIKKKVQGDALRYDARLSPE
jgi:serine/threonine protein kinase